MNGLKARRKLSLLAALVVCLSNTLGTTAATTSPHPTSKDTLESVNPFIGTAAHGHTYPGATVPFGMVQLSPDTNTTGWDWCSGYHWSDSSILGFSHTHLSGTGCGDLGDILFAPTVGKVNLVPGTREEPEKGYRSRFSHQDEKASPGYYSVLLKTYGIKAELTASRRTGVHRYTFPTSDEANVIIDLVHGIADEPIDLELNIEGERRVTGMRRSKGWAKDQYVFFAAEFSKPFKSFGTATDETKPEPGSRHAKGTKVKGWVTFQTNQAEPVIAKVGLSTVSTEAAERNLRSEVTGWDFDIVRQEARNLWRQNLDKIQINGAATKDKETFYTALYHALLAPTLISDADGEFRGSDQQIHQAPADTRIYSTFSLWDTFRAEQPLFTILEPQRTVNNMITSFLIQAKYHKDKTLPIWPLYANETYCMIGYHSFPVIAEAYAKKIRGWDTKAIFDLMLDNTKRNDWWAERGYMPADKENEAVSKTLEFAYDDWALAQFAAALGKDAERDKFLKRSQAYKNVFDPQTGFMRGRLEDGSWRTPFDPTDVTRPGQPHDFTEGNSWQYSFFAPHDIQGLINLMGGRDAFIKKLDAMFDHAPIKQEIMDADVSGLIGQYAQGNEPSHHVAYLYSYAGAPMKSADRIRQIRDKLYDNTPEGLCGNEDCGQMSAWYVFSALGFYPVNPVQATYVLGVPAFPKATITLPNGKLLTIKASNFSPDHPYIDKVKLDGHELSRVYVAHTELMDGGTLEFVMSDKAGNWGVDPQAAPPSMSSAQPPS